MTEKDTVEPVEPTAQAEVAADHLEDATEPQAKARTAENDVAPEGGLVGGGEAGEPALNIDPESEAGLRMRLSQLEAEKAELSARMLRAMADLDNFRKRARQEKAETMRFATGSLLHELLTVIDNFERAMQSAAENHSADSLQAGVEMIHRQLLDLVAKHGVKPIHDIGHAFDPNRHEAVGMAPSTEVKEGHILHEVQRGYMHHDRVLRPSRVVVAAASEEEE